MKYVLLAAQLMLLSSVAFAANEPAPCKLGEKDIVSRSSSGLAQVSNWGDSEIECPFPARPFPTEPGTGLRVPRVETAVYEVTADGSKKLVPSEATATGGRLTNPFSSTPTLNESVFFALYIPLDPAERDAEARRFLAKAEEEAPEELPKDANERALMARGLVDMTHQNRVGHFQLECRILDGNRLLGVGVIEFEVLFKRSLSDILDLEKK